MKLEDLISAKLLSLWPRSWEMFEESCLYSLKHGLDFVKGVLLYEEKPISFEERSSISEQLFKYLHTLGYEYMYAGDKSFCTKNGYKYGLVFVVFLSKDIERRYKEENERWNKWAAMGGSVMAGEKPKRPIYEQIEYLDIYRP